MSQVPQTAGSVVGFSYTVAEEGLQQLTQLAGKLQDFIDRLEKLKAVNPEEWTGTELDLYETLMADANKGLTTANENISSISSWLSQASAAHQSNESRNKSVLANAYANGTV